MVSSYRSVAVSDPDKLFLVALVIAGVGIVLVTVVCYTDPSLTNIIGFVSTAACVIGHLIEMRGKSD